MRIQKRSTLNVQPELNAHVGGIKRRDEISADISSAASARLAAVVRNNIIPFVGREAGDIGDNRLGIAHVEDFVRLT